MADNTLKFSRGAIIIFTSGCYSDFGLSGFLVAVKDCDLPALAKEYAKQEKEAIKARKGGDWENASPDQFPSWLVANGHAMSVDASTVHLGDYSEWEPEFGVPDGDTRISMK